MIVELLIGGGLMLMGAAAARVIVRRRGGAVDRRDGDAKPAVKKKTKRTSGLDALRKRARAAAAKDPRGTARGLRVGDVLLYADTELWLAGSVELDEEGLVMRIFVSPGSKAGDWVVQLDEVAADLAVLRSTTAVPDGAVPEALPIDGRRLTLERRGSADVRVEGEHLPHTSPRARYAILSDAGGRVLIVVDFEKAPRLALLGDRVSKQLLDLLPGGDLEADE
ncbi:MAG: hypothetical protein AB7S26_04535 [Sandaracinaceae bacterium]